MSDRAIRSTSVVASIINLKWHDFIKEKKKFVCNLLLLVLWLNDF